MRPSDETRTVSAWKGGLLACGSMLGAALLMVVAYLLFMLWASSHSRTNPADCGSSSPSGCAAPR